MAVPKRPALQIDLELITPETAAARLQLNERNRHIRVERVAALARDMKAGHWMNDGSPYRHAPDGVILDGQHRYMAILQAGVSVWGVVVRNVDPDTQLIMDTGMKRTFGDALQIRGVHYATLVASSTRLFACWEVGLRGVKLGHRSRPFTQWELWDYYVKHQEEVDRVARRAARLEHLLHGMSATWFALADHLFHSISPDDAEAFWVSVETGGSGPKSPAATFRRVLTANAARAEYEANDGYVMMAYAIKCWNAFRKGYAMDVVHYRPGGANPEPYPEPV